MKRYLKYIFLALAVTVLAASCIEELEPTPSLTDTDQVAVLVPRVQSFANHYITKAEDKPEQVISSLRILIFDNNGILVHTQDLDAGTRPFTLNKSMLNSPESKEKLTAATVVMLANMSTSCGAFKKADGTVINDSNIKSLTLDDIKNCTFSPKQVVITSIANGFDGFPMIGGKVVNLSSTSSNPETVDLKILYAKINFEISVDQDGENQRVDPSNTKQMQFQLSGYSVHNVSQVTPFNIPTNAGEPVRDIFGNILDENKIALFDEPTPFPEYTPTGISGSFSGTTTLNTTPLTFTFYMAESRYNYYDPKQADDSDPFHLKGIYPDDNEWLTLSQDLDVKGWKDLSPEERKAPHNKLNGVKYGYDHLIQQFKPKIVEKASNPAPGAGKAAYVLLTGIYTDYRGTNWNVNYKVYLGKDNAHNFHVDRNSEYSNIVTVKGVRNREEGVYGENNVWIDHRVKVTLDKSNSPSNSRADDCVSITRETLIDSHIEVRPLRLKWIDGTYDRVNIYLPTDSNGKLIEWIGIEKFTLENCQDGATYCFNDNGSTGKRKYFTTGLLSELQNMGGDLGVKTGEDGRQFLDCYNNHCAWIYFDENTTTVEREAVIRLEFYKNDKVTAIEEYTVRQKGLKSIEGTGYFVESYEEYLHSYDSADKYNLSTSPVDYTQQGLAWGFAGGKPLSEDIIVSSRQVLPVTEDARYDYFHESDANGTRYYTYTRNATTGNWSNTADAKPNYGTGLIFTDRASTKRSLTVKDMGNIPDNAYQYCLSKNKFNEENNTLDIHWYLPDVYELQTVFQTDASSAYFESGKYYWSSQPSFTEGQPKDEDPSKARAAVFHKSDAQTSVSIENLERNNQNRIRCFYSKEGIRANMINRVPDGLGGNFSFLMKGKNGYFNFIVDKVKEEDANAKDTPFKNEDFAYPTFENPGSTFGYFNNVVDKNNKIVEGFYYLPLNNTYWGPYQQTEYEGWSSVTYTYYKELTTFPGLSAEQLILDENRQTKGGSRPSGSPRTDIAIDSTVLTKKFETNLQGNKYQNNLSLNPLLAHPNPDKGTLLEISFNNNDNTNRNPQFKYSELVDGSKVVTTTRIWQVPTYAPNTYIPKADSATETFPGNGTAETDLIWNGWSPDYTSTEKDAKNKAIQKALSNALNAAQTKYLDRTCTIVSGTESFTATGSWNRWYTTYTATATGTVQITCTTKEETIPYYQDAENGGWKEKSKITEELDKVETDQLRIYSGNSFTITCTDPSYEITKVKVYFSGSNQIDQDSNWGTTTTYFARFVDDEIELPQSGDESTHLFGMEYNDSAMWQQWSGLGTQSVTLTLADFVRTAQADILGGLFGGGAWYKYTYKYQKAPQEHDAYFLVVDRIEVKCTEIKDLVE